MMGFEILQDFYGHLQDGQSREMFDCRLDYLVDGDKSRFASKSYVNLETLEGFLRQSDKKPVVYGAGKLGELVLEYLKVMDLSALCFCDSDIQKQGTDYLGIPVISPDALFEDYSGHLVINAVYYYADVLPFLLDNGIKSENIFTFHRCLYEVNYFDQPFLEMRPNEIMVDCGAFDGDTLVNFVAFTSGNYREVICLEPHPDNVAEIEKLIAKNGFPHVTVVPKAAWRQECQLEIYVDNVTSHASVDKDFLNSYSSAKKSLAIPATSIDSITGGKPVTFIKMDIEGAELEALKGAKNTIVRHKPRMAISIYHKPEDIINIPMYIHGLDLGYQYYIRHFSITPSETVLYCL